MQLCFASSLRRGGSCSSNGSSYKEGCVFITCLIRLGSSCHGSVGL